MLSDFCSTVKPSHSDIKVNQSDIITHLKAVGYQDGDSVWLRSIDIKGFSKIFKGTLKGSEFTLESCKKINKRWTPKHPVSLAVLNEMKDTYFVVNPSNGLSDETVYDYRSIFFECDVKSLVEQKQLIEGLKTKGFNPTIIFSGNKSFQCFFTLNEPLTESLWKEWMRKLASYCDSDLSIITLSRQMRLAGCPRVRIDGTKVLQSIVEIGSTTDIRDFEILFDGIFPHGVGDEYFKAFDDSGKESQRNLGVYQTFIPAKSFELPANLQIPSSQNQPLDLLAFISQSNRTYYLNGVGQGSRKSTGIALARDLKACENFIITQGHYPMVDADSLIRQWCQNVGLDNYEAKDLIVHSANSTPSKSYDVLVATLIRELSPVEPETTSLNDEVLEIFNKYGSQGYDTDLKGLKPINDTDFKYGFSGAKTANQWGEILANSLPIEVVQFESRAVDLILSNGLNALAVRNPHYAKEPRTGRLTGVLKAVVSLGCDITLDESLTALGFPIVRFSRELVKQGLLGKAVNVSVRTTTGSVIGLDTFNALKPFKYSANRKVTLVPTKSGLKLPDGCLESKAQLIGIKSQMGCGKTYQMVKVAEKFIEENPNGKIIPLGNRRTLLTELAGLMSHIVEIPELKELVKTDTKHIESFWSCFESMEKLNLLYVDPNEPSLILLDEFNQQLWSWLNSETCSSNRQILFDQLKTFITDYALPHPNSKIILLDESLNDVAVGYMESLTGLKCEKILAEKQPKSRELILYPSSFDVIAKAYHDLLNGGKIAICVNGAGEDSKLSVAHLKAYFEQNAPDKVGLAFNAKSIQIEGSDERQALQLGITAACKNVDYVIFNGVLVSGISIDDETFTGVYDVNSGSVGTHFEAIQKPHRVRSSCPIHAFYPLSVKHTEGAYIGSGSPFKSSILKEFNTQAVSVLKDLQAIKADYELSVNPESKCDEVDTWLSYATLINASKKDWARLMVHLYRLDGYTVSNALETFDTAYLKATLGEIQETSKLDRAISISSAESFGDEKYNTVVKQPSKTLKELDAILKVQVAHKALIHVEDVKPSHVDSFFEGDYKTILKVFDILNREDTLERDQYNFEQSSKFDIPRFKLDLIKNHRSLLSKFWCHLGFDKILSVLVLDGTVTFAKGDAQTIEIGKQAYKLSASVSYPFLGTHWKATADLSKSLDLGLIELESDKFFGEIGFYILKAGLKKFDLTSQQSKSKISINKKRVNKQEIIKVLSDGEKVKGFSDEQIRFYNRLIDLRDEQMQKRLGIHTLLEPTVALELTESFEV
jgi:hypothetical protein